MIRVTRWFRHGKWPRFWRYLHTYTIVSFIALLISGLLLWLPAVHTYLIPVLRQLFWLHILLGLIFTASLFAPLFKRLPESKRLRLLDWWMPEVFGSGIVLSGLFIWAVGFVPAAWANAGFWWHGVLSYVLAGWIVIHFCMKAVGTTPFADSAMMAKTSLERRRFLKWIGWSGAGAFALMVFRPGAWLQNAGRALSSGGTTTPPLGSRFLALYTVTGGYPKIDAGTYQLVIDGEVAAPQTLSYADLLKTPLRTETEDFHCVTGWSVGHVQWHGLSLKSVVNMVQPKASVKYVHFYSADGMYTENLRLSDATAGDVMLATHLDGKPLPQAQGYPLRLVVPSMYGYKSIKWVNRVTFSSKPLTGYWEARGYPDIAYVRAFKG